MSPPLSAEDVRAIEAHGLTLAEVERQLALFENPPPPIRLLRPATPGDGIETIRLEERAELLALHAEAASAGRLSKFVPASGAASRMFSFLSPLAAGGAVPPGAAGAVAIFAAAFRLFAFWPALAACLEASGTDPERATAADAARALLGTEGLGYAGLPKGLLAFHVSPGGAVTPFEEHLVEAALTVRDAAGVCRAHFTISPAHRPLFEALLQELRPRLGARFAVRLEVGFSAQEPATDTVAADPRGGPFRQADGSLLFRPGGHGALLENLGALSKAGGDVVFVKNIDNVLPERRRDEQILWKKLLAGKLLKLEREAGAERDARPLRVCGVVRNAGEPGGGPFWVDGPDGASLQIVESAQVDPGDPSQQGIFKGSTHFNPVDLVVSLRRGDGTPHALPDFVDEGTVFLSKKTHEGRELAALERPGLWNGAMARWTTRFVEVPGATFAPVKTLLDLLRPEHVG